MDFAEVLLKYTGEQAVAPVGAYIAGLGKCGAGLADGGDAVGSVFGERLLPRAISLRAACRDTA